MSQWNWDKVDHRRSKSQHSSIPKMQDEWQWETVKMGPSYTSYGRGTVGKILTEEVYDCGFCRGKGQKPAGSVCPVCRGQGTMKVDPPAVMCAYCKGKGQEKPRSNITCTCCKGSGIVRVNEPIEVCEHCKGRGAEPTNKLPCGKCRGSGVITVKIEIEPDIEIKPNAWQPFAFKKTSIKADEEKPRTLHKPSGSELDAMKIILNKGPIGAWKIGRSIGVSANYAEMICRSLRENGAIELCEGRLFTATPSGKKVMGENEEEV
ncbi:MAG: hypothetical protein H8E32_13970 [Nitrospinae bacterium]|nr:hypothetical protein [Nitrospinota bacterium]